MLIILKESSMILNLKKSIFLKMKMYILIIAAMIILSACGGGSPKTGSADESGTIFTGAKDEVKIMTLNPGHFHAALVQKTTYHQVSPIVYVYAPEGPDIDRHKALINTYNTRADDPTSWELQVYTGPDYFEEMLAEKPGNVMVTAGNNAIKTDYILRTVQGGINVLADKPMVISPGEFPKLEQAFKVAQEKGVLLYDIMTERYEITTILQRELSMIQDVFGTLQTGTPDEPAITKESVHHFYKYVSGSPLRRPAWFFDTKQQGEGMVDVTTHLIDLIQWEAFPETILSKPDVEIVSARRWTTDLTPEMFGRVTGMNNFPDYLQKDLVDGVLKVYSNGEINYKLKGIHAKVSVIWDYEAPEGAGDTHYSIMRGTHCNLVIKQGAEQGFKSTLYIEVGKDIDEAAFERNLQKAVNVNLQDNFPGISLVKVNDKLWYIEVPGHYRIGHEAHFAKVTEKYLQFLIDSKMPDWEVPNMIVKYYTIMEGFKAALSR
jgi:predicted dehydrogenase